MRKSTLILFGFLLLISCKANKKSGADESKTNSIKKINETEMAVQKILDLPKLQWIYHPELPQRLPVKLLKTAEISSNLNLNKFGQRVKIMSRAELENEGIKDVVEFDRLAIKNDTTDFELHYQVEGVSCAGKMVKVNGEWTILDYTVWEN